MIANNWVKLAAVLAALMGAAGVMLAAAAAHQPNASGLGSASNMLLFHAPAVIAAALLTAQGFTHLCFGMAATFMMAAGGALFSGDLAMRQYAGHALFPMAAPTGGTLLILSWLVLAIAAAWPRRAG